jgi:hypothetical protein
MYLSTYIGALIVALAALGAWVWTGMPEEHQVVDIMASREPDLALPVYAQFTVTQALKLDQPVDLTRLVVPIYFPAREVELLVSLRHEEQLVWRWRLKPAREGTSEVNLDLLSVRPAAGRFELTFAAPAITHEQRDAAPRLFIESDNGQYPGGNFRIADNEKEGDISLVVFERWTVRDRLMAAVERRPLRAAGTAGLALLGVVLAASLPSVLARIMWPGGAQEMR